MSVDTKKEDTLPRHIGPNKQTKMTPKRFAKAILEVFEDLGGASWLLIEAKADPKAFMSLLTKLIPKSVQLDGLAGFKVNLIDQFGASIEIQSQHPQQPENELNTELSTEAQRIGLPDAPVDNCGIATSGNPTSPYDIIDIFTED